MSEPQHIGEILPQAMQAIKNRCNRCRRQHGLSLLGENNDEKAERTKRVLAAVGGFMQSGKHHRA